jgi:hypothetical protein
MLRKISSTALWVAIFVVMVLVQVYSAVAQSNGEVVGYWKTGSVGSIGYQNQVTGAVKSGRGSIFSYKFLPNGNYEFIGYMEMNMYNCNNTLFNQITGKYSVAGNNIFLSPTRDFWKSTNSCAASGNKQQLKTPAKKVLEFQTKTNEYDQELLCISEGGGEESCYRKEKQ